jgi:hypothetical protein
MRKTALRLVPVVALLALAGCRKPCTELENRICSDLGADCELWKANGKIGLPDLGSGSSHGRSAARQQIAVALGLDEQGGNVCRGISSNYEPVITGIRTAMTGMKKAQEALQKAEELQQAAAAKAAAAAPAAP